MATTDKLRLEFLKNAMELYKDKSSLISSSCGVNALKLCSKLKQSSLFSNRVCESCGQILIFGKTKTIRFKTRKRIRNITISTLSKLINKTKHKTKLNYTIETCSYCNYKKYGKLSFTSLKYFKKQRLNKLKGMQNRKQVLNLKIKNNQSDKMKLDSKNIGLKTVENFKQFSKNKTNLNNNFDNNRPNEMDRLLGLTSSNYTSLNIQNKKKRSISNNVHIKFRTNKT
eukprot:UN02474